MLNCLEIKEIQNGMIDDPNGWLSANGICICFQALSYEIKGFTLPYGSWYQIVINSIVPPDQQRIALLHELAHIAKNDFDRSDPVDVIEQQNPF